MSEIEGGPMCCGRPAVRERYFSTILDFENNKNATHIGFYCPHCGKVRVAENEETAAERFRTV